MQRDLNIKTILGIIFKVVNKNANILAHSYLLKDESIISKWKNGKALPRNDDITRIVEFVVNESTVSQQNIIRDKIETLIKKEPLKSEIKNIILNTADFNEFLQEAISVSVSLDGDNYEPQHQHEEESRKENCVTGMVKNQDGRFKGVLEFDMVLSQRGESRSAFPAMGSEYELMGNVNLKPENKLVKTTKYARKAAAFGAVILFVVTGSIIASLTGNAENNGIKEQERKNTVLYSNLKPDASSISASKPTQKPDVKSVCAAEPTLKPLPTYTPIPSQAPSAVREEKQDISYKKSVNKQVNVYENITVVNNGDNAIVAAGNEIAVGVEKE